MLTSSSPSDEDSEDDSDDDSEDESELLLSLSLPDSDSDSLAFFFAAGLVFLGFSSDESEDPSDSDEEAALLFFWAGVEVVFCKALAASLTARASSSDHIGFSLNVAICFS